MVGSQNSQNVLCGMTKRIYSTGTVSLIEILTISGCTLHGVCRVHRCGLDVVLQPIRYGWWYIHGCDVCVFYPDLSSLIGDSYFLFHEARLLFIAKCPAFIPRLAPCLVHFLPRPDLHEQRYFDPHLLLMIEYLLYTTHPYFFYTHICYSIFLISLRFILYSFTPIRTKSMVNSTKKSVIPASG